MFYYIYRKKNCTLITLSPSSPYVTVGAGSFLGLSYAGGHLLHWPSAHVSISSCCIKSQNGLTFGILAVIELQKTQVCPNSSRQRFVPILAYPCRNSSTGTHVSLHYSEYMLLIMFPNIETGILSYIVMGMGFGKRCRQIFLPLDAQQEQHYSKMQCILISAFRSP